MGCYKTCPEGTYNNEEGNLCSPCDSECSACKGPG